jgi:O-antigen/teichoic acid export membrane protein
MILIPKFGIYGAAIATIVSWLIMSTAFYKFSFKFYKVKYELQNILLLISVGIGLYLVSLLFQNTAVYLRIILKLLLLTTFPFILWVFKFYEKVEITVLKEFFFKKNKKTNS